MTRNLQKSWHPADAMIGETIKGFRVVGVLGRGGMGDVWVAEQPIVRTRVAIKLLREQASADQQQVQRFFNEAIAAGKIKHTGIVKIFDVGFHAGRAFLIMELLEGETLTSRLRRMKQLPPGEVSEIARQIVSILGATHAENIIHRDLKPDNIFLVPDAELDIGFRIKILDFGIAKLGTGITGTGESMGTPGYMAPEQWSHAADADARADIYALGCLVFELCCGHPPFVAKSIPIVYAQQMNDLPPRASSILPDIPQELDDLIVRMLARSPEERPTVSEAGAIFTRLAGAHPYSSNVAAPQEKSIAEATTVSIAKTPRKRRGLLRSPRVIGLGIGTIILGLAFLIITYSDYFVEPPMSGNCPAGMVEIPGGTFQMGSPVGTGEPNEHPQHAVTLSAYCIDKTEITVRAYESCVQAGKCPNSPPTRNTLTGIEVKAWARYCNREDHPDHPINCVDWNQAATYCDWIGRRLPTEAEWEYAARGSDGRLYPWGNALPSPKLLNACGNECLEMGKRELEERLRPNQAMYDGNDKWEATAPVGSFPGGASPFGVLDMAGNVYEWTGDLYGNYSPEPATNPQGPTSGTRRVTRGGGWFSGFEDEARSTTRVPDDPAQRRVRLGFRCARDSASSRAP